MKKLIAFLSAVCLMMSCFSSLAATEQRAPRWNGFRGLNWGVSQAVVIAASADEDDPMSYYTGAASQDQINFTLLNFYRDVSVSKFDPQQVQITLSYILADDHLFLAGYGIHDSQDPEGDYQYLLTALSSLYGDPSEPAQKPLPPTIDEMGLVGSLYENFTFWDVDGTAVYAGVYQGSLMVMYYGYEYYTNLVNPSQNQDEINTFGL